MTIWFTSDTHFGHHNMMKFCPATRPYKDAEEMDEQLIKQWNWLIDPNDTVYHLGDFSFHHDPKKPEDIFNSLNGKKHLIKGNHDKKYTLSLKWVSVNNYLRIASDTDQIVMHHYPILEWDGFYRQAIHLYGHVHGKPVFTGKMENWRAIDAGIDGPFNRPFNAQELFEYMENRVNT